MNNPIQMLKTILNNKSPQELLTKMINDNSDPVMSNLVNMAQKGDNEGVQKFARNIFKEKGRDFDKEFSEFMNNFK